MSVFAPHLTLFPITILVKAPITVPENPQLSPISIIALAFKVEIIHRRLIPIKLESTLDLKVQLSPIEISLKAVLLKVVIP
mgnify:CR=1 FL=1